MTTPNNDAFPDVWDVQHLVDQLDDMKVPPELLVPLCEWLSEQHTIQDDYHRRHLAACGIAQLAGHGYGWSNCPDFTCNHCGRPPEKDGDHTCFCPNRDGECSAHDRPKVVPNA